MYTLCTVEGPKNAFFLPFVAFSFFASATAIRLPFCKKEYRKLKLRAHKKIPKLAFIRNSIFAEKRRPLVQFPWADTLARARNKVSTFSKIAFEGYLYVQAVS